MPDYMKLSELIEKVHELEPEESDCEFLDSQVSADTLINAGFDINSAVRDTMSLLIYDRDTADLMGVSEDTYEILKELAEQGSSSAAEKLNSLWENAYNATYSRIHEYQISSIGVYLADMLKKFDYTSDSPVHPCIVDAIDSCIDNEFTDIYDFESALYEAMINYSDGDFYLNLPEDFEFESLDTKFKFIKDHTEGFYTSEKEAAAPERAQDTPSLSSLAQEAKTASHTLSSNDRNIEVKEHEER